MNEARFWQLIEDNVDRSDVAELDISDLQNAVAELEPDEIASWGHHFDRIHQASYTTRLWGAAYLINGGCSDDGFDYFRGWLIAMGRETYDKAMQNPDSLAAVAEEDVECADMVFLAPQAYEDATGTEMPFGPDNDTPPGEEDDWDFNDDAEMKARYPRLFARFAP